VTIDSRAWPSNVTKHGYYSQLRLFYPDDLPFANEKPGFQRMPTPRLPGVAARGPG